MAPLDDLTAHQRELFNALRTVTACPQYHRGQLPPGGRLSDGGMIE